MRMKKYLYENMEEYLPIPTLRMTPVRTLPMSFWRQVPGSTWPEWNTLVSSSTYSAVIIAPSLTQYSTVQYSTVQYSTVHVCRLPCSRASPHSSPPSPR